MPRPRRLGPLLALLPLLILTAACTTPPGPDAATTAPGTSATTEADTDLHASDGLECARLTVPLDHDDPGGRTAHLGVLRVRSTGEPTGSLVVNPGGPASPGMAYAAQLKDYPGYGRLAGRLDLVGFDVRGTTYRKAVDVLLFSLYDPKSWPVITTGLGELAAGRGARLLAAHDVVHQRQGDGSCSAYLEGAFATHCNDKERQSPEQESAMRERMLRAAPFLDDGRPRPARDACEHWPAEPTLGYPYVTETGAVLVASDDCVDEVAADHLTDLDLPPADARCSL